MHQNKLDTYRKNQATMSSPREIEATALTLGAQKLMNCRDNWDSEDRKKLLQEALKFNQKLWTIFQADLGGPNSLLPMDLRLNLLRLSAYIDRQIFAIMAHPEPEMLTRIININLNLAKGLRSKEPSVVNKNSIEDHANSAPMEFTV